MKLFNRKRKSMDEIEDKRFGYNQSLLECYIIYGIKKYGIDNVYGYLQAYKHGNLNGITLENNFRNLFESYLTPNLVDRITNGNLQEYIQRVYQNNIDEFTVSTTYNHKYYTDVNQKLLNEYIKYAIGKYGVNNVYSYLGFYMQGHSNGITSDNGFRKQFEDNLTPDIINTITNGNLQEYIYQVNEELNNSITR